MESIPSNFSPGPFHTMKENTPEQEALFIPNVFGRLLLQAYEEVMGDEGLIELHTRAGLEHLIQDLPPNNLQPHFYADEIGLLHCCMKPLKRSTEFKPVVESPYVLEEFVLSMD
jgi:hypothetical protein